MVRAVGLTKESKDLIHQYVVSGVIRESQVYHIWKAESREEIESALKLLVSIDSISSTKIWVYIIDEVFDKDDIKNTVFTPDEIIFFRELLRYRGAITRSFALENVLSTPYMVDRVTSSLEEMGIIKCLSMQNNNTIYLLDPKFYSSVLKTFVGDKRE